MVNHSETARYFESISLQIGTTKLKISCGRRAWVRFRSFQTWKGSGLSTRHERRGAYMMPKDISPTHFGRAFRCRFGVTPREYRECQAAGTAGGAAAMPPAGAVRVR